MNDNSNYFFVPKTDLAGCHDLQKQMLKSRGGFESEILKIVLAEMIVCIKGLHEIGIAHNDIKPDNFVVKFNGHLVLVDFGLSKLKPEDVKHFNKDWNQLSEMISTNASLRGAGCLTDILENITTDDISGRLYLQQTTNHMFKLCI